MRQVFEIPHLFMHPANRCMSRPAVVPGSRSDACHVTPSSEAVFVPAHHRFNVEAARQHAWLVFAVVACVPMLRWWRGHLDDDGVLTAACALVAGGYGLASTAHGATHHSVARVAILGVATVAVVLGVLSDVQLVQAAGLVMALAATTAVVRRAPFVAVVPALLLLLLALPARGDLDTFVGFPLRLMSASMASSVLSPLLGVVPRETVLVLEGRVADVEVACSGVSTVWVALLCVGLLAHEQQRRRGWRFPWTTLAVAASTTFVTVMLANTARVTLLAAVGLWPQLDDRLRSTLGALIHVPLGVLTLLAAVAAGAVVLWRAPQADSRVLSIACISKRDRLSIALVWLLLAAAPWALGPPRVATATPTQLAERSAPLEHAAAAALAATPIPLDATERGLFAQHADAAAKLKLADGGTVLLVQARSPTAHHAPERCLASAGHTIVASADNDGVRTTVLDDGRLLGVSFFASNALSDGVTLASPPERLWLAGRERLAGNAAPAVTFVSALWRRADVNTSTTLTPNEHARVQQLRATLTTLVQQGAR
jgi:exosortase O